MSEIRVAAIVQARMRSSRFPGKVLKPLAGKPVLWHVIHRLKKCGTVTDVAVATSVSRVDDPLVEFCARENIPCIRGSEENVLDRYRQAAQALEADVIVRVTGDAPLVDPGTIDRLVKALIDQDADYATGDPQTPTIHEGFSPFSRNALDRLVAEASEEISAREHVTAYIKEHPESFQTVHISMPGEHRFEGARLSVDTPADLRFMEELYSRLDVAAGDADVADVVRILTENPELLEINTNVRQKTADERTRRAIIRCDGDGMVGLGHVVRCLALAEELRTVHSWGVTFAMASGETGFRMVTDAGFALETMSEGADEGAWVDGLINTMGPDALIMDFRTDLSRSWVKGWRKKGVLIVDIDDPGDRRLESDLAFYPPVPQVREMSWQGFTGELFSGWEWVILRRQFSDPPIHRASKPGGLPVVLVTMGGSDPAGLTVRALRALDLVEEKFRVIAVVGKAFPHRKELEQVLKEVSYPVELLEDVDDMASVMSRADLAVASFGVTAYELAAMGVPAVFLCLTEDHARSVSLFEEARIGVNLGVHSKVREGEIRKALMKLLADPVYLKDMSQEASSLVDGRGSARVGALMVETVSSRGGSRVGFRQGGKSKLRDAVVCLAAGESQILVIRKAKELGFAVIAVDQNSRAPGFALSDESLVLSTHEAEPVIDALRKFRKGYDLRGVVNRSSGPPVITAGEICRAFSLPGISPEVARSVVDKGKLMKICRERGIPAPDCQTVTSPGQVDHSRLRFPCVVKPALSLLGKSGVRVIHSPHKLNEAIIFAEEATLNGKVNVEEYLPGHNVTLLAWVQEGDLLPLVLLDELVMTGADGCVRGLGVAVPSRFWEQPERNRIVRLAKVSVERLGIGTSVFLMSCRCQPGKEPKLIEIHLDMGGDLVLDILLPDSTSFDFPAFFVRGLIGEKQTRPDIEFRPVAVCFGKGAGLIAGRHYELIQASSRMELEDLIARKQERQ